MPRIVVHKEENFTVIANGLLRDNRLSLKATGLMCKLLSLPEDWNYSINGLVSICKEGESAVKAALDELKEYGYLVIERCNPDKTESGRIEYIYHIYEVPVTVEPKTSTRFQGGCNKAVETGGYIKETDKERKYDRATPSAAETSRPSSSGGKLFSTTPKPKRSSVQKTNDFIKGSESYAGKHFSEEVFKSLQKYFRMLAESGTLLPFTSMQAQMDLLKTVPEQFQAEVVEKTISHGWKSLEYVANDYKGGKRPSFDTAVESTFTPKSEEDKKRNLLEGADPDDVF